MEARATPRPEGGVLLDAEPEVVGCALVSQPPPTHLAEKVESLGLGMDPAFALPPPDDVLETDLVVRGGQRDRPAFPQLVEVEFPGVFQGDLGLERPLQSAIDVRRLAPGELDVAHDGRLPVASDPCTELGHVVLASVEYGSEVDVIDPECRDDVAILLEVRDSLPKQYFRFVRWHSLPPR